MIKEENEDFGYLGYEFQAKLMSTIMKDQKFGGEIVEHIKPSYMDDTIFSLLLKYVIQYHKNYGKIPSIKTLEQYVKEERKGTEDLDVILDAVTLIDEVDLEDGGYIQDVARKFCTQQSLKKALKECEKILERGDDFTKCRDIIEKSLDLYNEEEPDTDMSEGIEDVLSEDYRIITPCGIKGIDSIMNGGLGKQELAIGIAPLGTGKTTLSTYIANHIAYVENKKVVQIFFEDKVKEIRRKHIAKLSSIEINDISNYKDEARKIWESYSDKHENIKLKKFKSHGVNASKIHKYLKNLRAKGFYFDVVIIDYIDCIETENNSKESEYSSEGLVVRKIEAMAEEFDCAIWGFIQSNRDGIGAEIVGAQHAGGSIKKIQYGHFIFSLARTLQQKETKRANITIIKSRFGSDGKTFEGVLFDNATLTIDTDDETHEFSFSELEDEKEKKRQKTIEEALKRMEAKENKNKPNKTSEKE